MSSPLSGSRVTSPAAAKEAIIILKRFDVEEIYHVQEIMHEKLRRTKQAQRVTRKKFLHRP